MATQRLEELLRKYFAKNPEARPTRALILNCSLQQVTVREFLPEETTTRADGTLCDAPDRLIATNDLRDLCQLVSPRITDKGFLLLRISNYKQPEFDDASLRTGLTQYQTRSAHKRCSVIRSERHSHHGEPGNALQISSRCMHKDVSGTLSDVDNWLNELPKTWNGTYTNIDLRPGITRERKALGLATPTLDAGRRLLTSARHCPGIHAPFLYVSGPDSITTLHIEDCRLYSANILLCGAPKVWVIVHPRSKEALEQSARVYFDLQDQCSSFIRHQNLWIPPQLLIRWKISFRIVVQEAGDLVLTDIDAYHQVRNTGPNIAEAVNIALEDFSCERWTDCPGTCGVKACAIKKSFFSPTEYRLFQTTDARIGEDKDEWEIGKRQQALGAKDSRNRVPDTKVRKSVRLSGTTKSLKQLPLAVRPTLQKPAAKAGYSDKRHVETESSPLSSSSSEPPASPSELPSRTSPLSAPAPPSEPASPWSERSPSPSPSPSPSEQSVPSALASSSEISEPASASVKVALTSLRKEPNFSSTAAQWLSTLPRTLTDPCQRILAQFANRQLNQCTFHGGSLAWDDLSRLLPGCDLLLSDRLVTALISHACETEAEKDVYVRDPAAQDKDSTPDNDYLICPCRDNSHWSLLVLEVREKMIYHYSHCHTSEAAIYSYATRLFGDLDITNWSAVHRNLSPRDEADCGIYTIAMALRWAGVNLAAGDDTELRASCLHRLLILSRPLGSMPMKRQSSSKDEQPLRKRARLATSVTISVPKVLEDESWQAALCVSCPHHLAFLQTWRKTTHWTELEGKTDLEVLQLHWSRRLQIREAEMDNRLYALDFALRYTALLQVEKKRMKNEGQRRRRFGADRPETDGAKQRVARNLSMRLSIPSDLEKDFLDYLENLLKAGLAWEGVYKESGIHPVLVPTTKTCLVDQESNRKTFNIHSNPGLKTMKRHLTTKSIRTHRPNLYQAVTDPNNLIERLIDKKAVKLDEIPQERLFAMTYDMDLASLLQYVNP